MAYALNATEEKQLKRLLDKRRDYARKEAAFWTAVDERRAEVLRHYQELDALDNAGGNAGSYANSPTC